MNINNKFRIARMSKGYTQTELARQTGISRATINSIERGHNQRPSDETMIVLAEFLGCSIEDIFSTPLIQRVKQESQDKSA